MFDIFFFFLLLLLLSFYPSCRPVSVLDKLLSLLHVHIMQLSVFVCAASNVEHLTISHLKCPTVCFKHNFLKAFQKKMLKVCQTDVNMIPVMNVI